VSTERTVSGRTRQGQQGSLSFWLSVVYLTTDAMPSECADRTYRTGDRRYEPAWIPLPFLNRCAGRAAAERFHQRLQQVPVSPPTTDRAVIDGPRYVGGAGGPDRPRGPVEPKAGGIPIEAAMRNDPARLLLEIRDHVLV